MRFPPPPPLIVAAELRRIANVMDPTDRPSEAPLANRTRQLWADYLRMRAAELDDDGVDDPAPTDVTGPAVTCPAGPGATNPTGDTR